MFFHLPSSGLKRIKRKGERNLFHAVPSCTRLSFLIVAAIFIFKKGRGNQNVNKIFSEAVSCRVLLLHATRNKPWRPTVPFSRFCTPYLVLVGGITRPGLLTAARPSPSQKRPHLKRACRAHRSTKPIMRLRSKVKSYRRKPRRPTLHRRTFLSSASILKQREEGASQRHRPARHPFRRFSRKGSRRVKESWTSPRRLAESSRWLENRRLVFP